MPDKTIFAGAITESRLRKLAGDRYFARGAAYFEDGAVVRLRCDEREIWARVLGTQPYAVRLWLDGKKLDWGCSCPLGIEGEICKHLVATGLAFLSGEQIDNGPEAEDTSDLGAIRHFLEHCDRQTLVEALADLATWDENLAAELLLPNRARPPKVPVASNRRSLKVTSSKARDGRSGKKPQ